MLNTRNKIRQWSLTKENTRYLVWAKPEFTYMLLCYHCFTHSVTVIFPKWKPNPAKKYIVKEVPHRPAQTERGLQWFKTSFWLLDNSTMDSYCLIPKKREIQINNPTKYYITPLQVLNSKKLDNNATFTPGLPTKIKFYG